MRPVATAAYSHTGNAQREIAMKIDLANAPQLMEMMTSLYSDQQKAVIREYSTNALDAHVEAGNSEPIMVTLPTVFSPTFIVKDNGIGMSVDDIENIYSSYGTSTKRNTDDQSGMLGVGGKSGLTLSDQFTITARKEGIKTVAVMTRKENGAGVIKILDTSATKEPNGFEVAIPINPVQVDQFREKAENFFQWWESGTVLVDGKIPAPADEWEKVSDDLYIQNSSYTYSGVVMGNIFYPTSSVQVNGYRWASVLRVPMGSVEFTPSRESLKYTDHTNAGLEKAAQKGTLSARAYFRGKAKSLPLMDRFRTQYKFRDWQVGDLGVPEFVSLTGYTYSPSASRGKVDRHNTSINNRYQLDNDVYAIVKDFTNADFTAANGKRVMAYIESKGWDAPDKVLVMKDHTAFAKQYHWFDAKVIDWADVKAFKMPRKASASTASGNISKVTGSQWYGTGWATEDIKVSDLPAKYYIISPTTVGHRADTRRENARTIAAYAVKHKIPLYLLAANRHEKWIKENSGAEMFTDYLTDAATTWYNDLSDAEKLAASGLTKANWTVDGTGDDDIQSAFDSVSLDNAKELAASYNEIYRVFRAAGTSMPTMFEDVGAFTQKVYDKYPLLEHIGYNTPDAAHVVQYVKAINFMKESEA